MAVEEFATTYLVQGPVDLWLSVCALVCVGGLIGGVAGFAMTSRLRRRAFFFWSSLFILIVSFSQYWMLDGPEAIAANEAGPLALRLMLVPALVGFPLGLMAAARSRDAFGHPKAAPLAFVPLANLWLLLAPSRPSRGKGGGVDVAVAGLFLLALAALLGSLLPHQIALAFGRADGVPPSVSVQHLVNAEGLEGGVAFIANRAKPPYRLSDTLTLSSVEAAGAEIATTYTFKAGGPLPKAFWTAVKNQVCANELMLSLLKAGATVREIYVDDRGRKVGDLPVTRQDCHLKPEMGAWSRLAGLIGHWPKGMTLEDRAIGFSLDADRRIQTAGLCLVAIGGLLSALFTVRGGTARLGRGGYFLGNCALILAAAASQALLIPTRSAVFGGHVGLMVALWATVQMACGFALWRLALMRSRSAYGHGKAAVLAFIPLVNVWLVVAPEREAREEAGVVVRSRRTAMPIAAGLAGLALLGLAYAAQGEIGMRTVVSLVVNEDFPPEMRVEHMLGRLGLEETLEAATEAPPEPDGDKLVPQLAHSARGKELLRTFLIAPAVVEEMERGNPALATFFADMARREVCEGKTFIPLLEAGATIVNSYGDGEREREVITLTAADCGF